MMKQSFLRISAVALACLVAGAPVNGKGTPTSVGTVPQTQASQCEEGTWQEDENHKTMGAGLFQRKAMRGMAELNDDLSEDVEVADGVLSHNSTAADSPEATPTGTGNGSMINDILERDLKDMKGMPLPSNTSNTSDNGSPNPVVQAIEFLFVKVSELEARIVKQEEAIAMKDERIQMLEANTARMQEVMNSTKATSDDQDGRGGVDHVSERSRINLELLNRSSVGDQAAQRNLSAALVLQVLHRNMRQWKSHTKQDFPYEDEIFGFVKDKVAELGNEIRDNLLPQFDLAFPRLESLPDSKGLRLASGHFKVSIGGNTILNIPSPRIEVKYPQFIRDVIDSMTNFDEEVLEPISDLAEAFYAQSMCTLRDHMTGAGALQFPAPHEGPRVVHSSPRETIKLSSNEIPQSRAALLGLSSKVRRGDDDKASKWSMGVGYQWVPGDLAVTYLMTQFGGVEKYTGSCLGFAPTTRSGGGGEKVTERDWQTPSLDDSQRAQPVQADFVRLEPWAVPCGNDWMTENADKWEGFSFYTEPSPIEKCVEFGIQFAYNPVFAFVKGIQFDILPTSFAAKIKVCWPTLQCGTFSQMSIGIDAGVTPLFYYYMRSVRRFGPSAQDPTAVKLAHAYQTYCTKALGMYDDAIKNSHIASVSPYETIGRSAELLESRRQKVEKTSWAQFDVDNNEQLSPEEVVLIAEDFVASIFNQSMDHSSVDKINSTIRSELMHNFERADSDADGALNHSEVLMFAQMGLFSSSRNFKIEEDVDLAKIGVVHINGSSWNVTQQLTGREAAKAARNALRSRRASTLQTETQLKSSTAPYIRGQKGVDACPWGYEPIEVASSCQAAASTLGLQYNPDADGDDGVCFYAGSGCDCARMGTAHGGGAEWICKQQSEAPTPAPTPAMEHYYIKNKTGQCCRKHHIEGYSHVTTASACEGFCTTHPGCKYFDFSSEYDTCNLCADCDDNFSSDAAYDRYISWEKKLTDGYHLAPPGASECDYGNTIGMPSCLSVAQQLSSALGATMGSPHLHVGQTNNYCNLWGGRPSGCSLRSGDGWLAFYNQGAPSSTCNTLETHQLICTGLPAATQISYGDVQFGNGFIQLGEWRIGVNDANQLAISHKDGQTAQVFLANGSVLQGPRVDTGLWNRPLGVMERVAFGMKFIQLGDFRIGEVDAGRHASISHTITRKTSRIWVFNNGIRNGPRSDFGLWNRQTGETDVVKGDGFIQLGKWRLGDCGGKRLSMLHEDHQTVEIFSSDGTSTSSKGTSVPGVLTDCDSWSKSTNSEADPNYMKKDHKLFSATIAGDTIKVSAGISEGKLWIEPSLGWGTVKLAAHKVNVLDLRAATKRLFSAIPCLADVGDIVDNYFEQLENE